MRDPSLLGPWVRRFLLEHLVGERNLSRNTQRSYRDALRLLLPAVARHARKAIDRLVVTDVSADRVRHFLSDLEENRGCGIATRNQRLAAIHALARFIGLRAPELVEWCGQVRLVPFKKGPRELVTYLEKPEMDALLAAPDLATAQGRRDHAVLQFLYNTGTRASEVAQFRISDLNLPREPSHDQAWAVIQGKGNKRRLCPLWASTAQELRLLIGDRAEPDYVFLNRQGQPLTRFGVHALVERYARRVAPAFPLMTKKRVSPHTIRHTTATHLLRSGVDINTIRAWLGHVSLTTTNVYAEVDLEMKAKALSNCEVEEGKSQKHWREEKGLMEFLQAL
jgi:site-specific recombinase XerD